MFKLTQNNGSSLIEGLIGGALLSVLALIFTTLINQTMRGQAMVMQTAELSTSSALLKMATARGDECAKALLDSAANKVVVDLKAAVAAQVGKIFVGGTTLMSVGESKN